MPTLEQHNIKLVWAVETHGHADHITSAWLLAEHTGAWTAAPAGCGIGTASVQLQDGETLSFGGEQIRAMHTPGHTRGSMCYLWRNQVFTGDTLLIGTCGRTDFQSGNPEAMYDSLTNKLFSLPDETIVWPGQLPGTLKVIIYPEAWQLAKDKTKYFPIYDASAYVQRLKTLSQGQKIEHFFSSIE